MNKNFENPGQNNEPVKVEFIHELEGSSVEEFFQELEKAKNEAVGLDKEITEIIDAADADKKEELLKSSRMAWEKVREAGDKLFNERNRVHAELSKINEKLLEEAVKSGVYNNS
jgi:hypothetical protein